MGFQSTVNIYTGLGVPGELAFDGPIRSAPYNLFSSATPNIYGYAFTVSNGANPDTTAGSPNAGTATVGGTGIFAGILVNPKAASSNGSSTNPLAATLTVPDYSIGELLFMGEVFVNLTTTANVGDLVTYATATGAIGSVKPTASFTGVIAVTTGVLTVSAITAGSTIAVGQPIFGTGVPGGTVITALGSGTGGNGTYNTNIVTAVGSTAMTSPNQPPAGSLFIPHCVVDRFDVAVAGVAVIKLTN